MDLESAIQHLKESLADPTHKWGCEECKAEHEQLLEWLEEYKRLKDEMIPAYDEAEIDEVIAEIQRCTDLSTPGFVIRSAETLRDEIAMLKDYKQLKADYIELDRRLRTANTEIDRLQSVSSWISCSVKKPEAYKSVLVVIKDNDRYTWINIGETDEDGNWMIGGEFWYSKSDTSITHWMPTPELPKEVHHAEN